MAVDALGPSIITFGGDRERFGRNSRDRLFGQIRFMHVGSP